MTPQVPKISEPMSTVFSMIHQELREEKPGLLPNVFVITAGTIDKPSANLIKPAQHYVYLDGDRGSLPVRDTSAEVARSIVEDYIGSQMCVSDGCFPGLFWIPGTWSLSQLKEHSEYKEILSIVKIAHQRWMLKLTQQADDDFARYQKHNVVSDFQRKIAEIMHLPQEKHPWMNVANSLESDNCVHCGSLCNPKYPICPVCKNNHLEVLVVK
jgi:hypothetical protein